MRFHEPLIAMRRQGSKPSAVFLVVDCCTESEANWPAWTPGHACIVIDPADVPHRLDLRCIVGCEVHVQGFDERRIKAVYEAAIAAGAAMVATVFDDEVHIHSREVAHG